MIPLDYCGHKLQDLAVIIHMVKNMLKFGLAVYSMEGDQMMFAEQYLIGNAAAMWDQYCARHSKFDHTWAAIRGLLYSQMAPTKHHTNPASQKLYSVKQGP